MGVQWMLCYSPISEGPRSHPKYVVPWKQLPERRGFPSSWIMILSIYGEVQSSNSSTHRPTAQCSHTAKKISRAWWVTIYFLSHPPIHGKQRSKGCTCPGPPNHFLVDIRTRTAKPNDMRRDGNLAPVLLVPSLQTTRFPVLRWKLRWNPASKIKWQVACVSEMCCENLFGGLL